jgi:hypothetical protein
LVAIAIAAKPQKLNTSDRIAGAEIDSVPQSPKRSFNDCFQCDVNSCRSFDVM